MKLEPLYLISHHSRYNTNLFKLVWELEHLIIYHDVTSQWNMHIPDLHPLMVCINERKYDGWFVKKFNNEPLDMIEQHVFVVKLHNKEEAIKIHNFYSPLTDSASPSTKVSFYLLRELIYRLA
jgi:hypothetical protein